MALVIIEENKDIKGYFSIKGRSMTKKLDYYIEAEPTNRPAYFKIVYVLGNKGFNIKTITEPFINSKKIYKGTFKDINKIEAKYKGTYEEGFCILGEYEEVLFAEYLNKKKINIDKLTIEDFNEYDNSNNSLPLEKENYIEKKDDYIKQKEEYSTFKIKSFKSSNYKSIIKKQRHCKDSNHININGNTNKNNILEFINSLSNKATKFKKTKVYSKDDLVIRISYHMFKESFIQKNEYFILIDSIVNLFKNNIKKHGHFLISVIFKRNGQIKYIQIGIPDINGSLNLQNLSYIKYNSLSESNRGYWLYKYEF